MRILHGLLFIVLVIFTVSCGVAPATEPLNGSNWTLTQLNGHTLLAGSHIEIIFDAHDFSGFGGCNAYGGSYRVQGAKFTVAEGVETTDMYCEVPEGVSEQEQAFYQALTKSAAYQLVGRQLEIMDQTGEVILLFVHDQKSGLVNPDDLLGTQWSAVSMDGEQLIADSQITIGFGESGLVRGFAGCRNYEAEYQTTEDGFAFTSTRMLEETCADETLSVQEGTFTDHFTWATGFELIDEKLILKTDRGGEVVFVPRE